MGILDIFKKPNAEEIVFQKNIKLETAANLLYELRKALEFKYPICSASFNVILEGLYRDCIHENCSEEGFFTQLIEYNRRKFYIRKIQINNNSKDFFLPIKIQDDSYNQEPIYIKRDFDDFYSFYELNRSKGRDIRPRTAELNKKSDEIATIAKLYAIITKEHYFAQENQYLKAMLFKMMFNTQNERQPNCISNNIINIAYELVVSSFLNAVNGCIRPESSVNLFNEDEFDSYLIHEAFIIAYGELNDTEKNIIIEILRKYHPGTI